MPWPLNFFSFHSDPKHGMSSPRLTTTTAANPLSSSSGKRASFKVREGLGLGVWYMLGQSKREMSCFSQGSAASGTVSSGFLAPEIAKETIFWSVDSYFITKWGGVFPYTITCCLVSFQEWMKQRQIYHTHCNTSFQCWPIHLKPLFFLCGPKQKSCRREPVWEWLTGSARLWGISLLSGSAGWFTVLFC